MGPTCEIGRAISRGQAEVLVMEVVTAIGDASGKGTSASLRESRATDPY